MAQQPTPGNPSSRLWAIRDRLSRADEHFEVVKGMTGTYLQTYASRFSGDYDPGPNQSMPFPDIRLATVLGELVHDIRSSLDHLAWALSLHAGGNPGENTYWPILKSPPKANAQGIVPPLTISGGVSPTALALIERSQPYWSGLPVEHDELLVLHRLSIIDKHRHIAVEGALVSRVSFYTEATVQFTWHSELISATDNSAEVRLVPDDPAVDVDGQATLHVVVPEPPSHPASLVTTIDSAIKAIRGIVDEAEQTCF